MNQIPPFSDLPKQDDNLIRIYSSCMEECKKENPGNPCVKKCDEVFEKIRPGHYSDR